ncbi:trigger factor [Gordonia jinhuaensis]|uniref:Trigger factor n=1 Tax=Gordonia jinhuaensis TaxID=1517702 RepID=A0A916T3N6_9ACTN|nr:trigger factor [Gordonia jinhuaensis]GGB30645.1 trigger factor [Gordonia jinhuaensis]
MKSTVEQLSPTRVKLNVEVPFEELKDDFARTYKQLAQQVRIPGFRPGKAPAKLIEARVGRDAVLAQVVNDALPGKYSEAIAETETNPIGQPDIDLSELEYGQAISFTAEVDVRPEIETPDFASLSVEVEPISIDDAEVDEQLQKLRERFGTLKGVERAAQDGDFVNIDLSGEIDGEEIEEAATEGLSHEIGSGELIDGLDEALIGLTEGDSKTFTADLVAGDHAGQPAQVTVKVNSIKERELPEVDDEFAQMASEFDTVDELKDDLRTRVEQSKKLEQANAISSAVLDKLLDSVEVPLPESVVDAEVENQQHQIIHALGHDDEQLAKFLEAQGTTREEWDAESKESAEKSVKTQLLLDALADEFETEVSQDELTQQIIFQAQRYGMAPQQFIQELQRADQVGAVYADLRRNKALASVVSKVTVTDADGNTVDTAEFFPADDVDDESTESASTETATEDEAK